MQGKWTEGCDPPAEGPLREERVGSSCMGHCWAQFLGPYTNGGAQEGSITQVHVCFLGAPQPASAQLMCCIVISPVFNYVISIDVYYESNCVLSEFTS